jgi:DNA primase
MKNSVLDVLKLKGIDYRDTGGDILIKCLNPEHNDANPSLRIHRETGAMHCLSCGFGKGIPSIFEYFNEDTRTDPPLLYSVQKMINDLLAGNKYLSVPDSASPYEGNYRDLSPELYKKYFAFQHIDWEGRVVFPITDSVGRIVVFLGRSLNGSAPPKYLLKPKDVSAPLFPLRQSGVIIIVEGIFDMLNLEDKGVDNAVACFGTHQFSIQNTADKFMSQVLVGTHTVILLLDNDKSGNAASEKLAKFIRDKTRIRPIIANHLLPDDKDPGSLDLDEVNDLKKNINILLAESV